MRVHMTLERAPHEVATLAMVAWGPLQGVIFDPGDVLYDNSAWRRWLVRLFSRLGFPSGDGSPLALWERQFQGDVYCGRRNPEGAFRDFLVSLGLSRGQIDEVEAASLGRRRQLGESLRLFRGAAEMLRDLQGRSVKLAVLADCEIHGDQLCRRCQQAGVPVRLDGAVTSLDLGCTKPDPVCYESILQRLELGPGQVAFVGRDAAGLQGARAAGLRTVAFNYEPDAEADVRVSCFEDMRRVFCRWQSTRVAA